MQERWIEYGRKADFQTWARILGVSPLTARIMVNRGIGSIDEARLFLHGGPRDLSHPSFMIDMEKAVDLTLSTVRDGGIVTVINDYDCDGIFSGQIVYEAVSRIGGTAFVLTPNRMSDGYGVNRRLIDEAHCRGSVLIITTDNGISAIEEIAYAKSLGFRVIVTDHHEVRMKEENGTETMVLPDADCVVDLKRRDSESEFKELCGAGVALKFAMLLYEKAGVPKEEIGPFFEYAAIATVADVVPLLGENRIIAKEGIRRLRDSVHPSIRAIMRASKLDPANITSYSVGFVIGPAFNAIGRIADPELAFRFLSERDEAKLDQMAEEIRGLNEERKRLTEEGTVRAESEIGSLPSLPNVLVVTLENVSESVIGIIAGRLKDRYHRPAIVLTDSSEEGVMKGSARSIEEYHLAEHLAETSELLLRFGGHKLAAGLSLKKENVPAFAALLNERCGLRESDLQPKIMIDARAPLSYLTKEIAEELSLLEPFGQDNDRPLFAGAHFTVERMRLLGEKRNALRLSIRDTTGSTDEAVFFGDVTKITDVIRESYGTDALQSALAGRRCSFDLAFTFYPEINVYRERESVQAVIRNCCKIPEKVV